MAMFVADPFDVRPDTPCGGKARALAALAGAGLPVPPWFVVLPAAFDASVASGSAASPAGIGEEAQGAVAARIRLAPDVAAAVSRALAAFAPTDRFALRSSALQEDSARHSFAGQLESVLDVAAAEVAERLKDVWVSGFAARLVRYRAETGLAAEIGAPAVIVQRMVEGDASGVAFSADPVSGRRAIAVVAATRGRGSALVGGEAEGDTWRVARDGRIVERPREAAGAALQDADAVRVAALARDAERHFGVPQDIEWTIAQGELFLLQSRPITTLGALADPDAKRAVWDNANIVESYSGVTTPLTFSFARRCYEQVYREFCRLVGVPPAIVEARGDVFACMLGLFRGRVYYNLFNWYRLVALLPGYALNRRFMEQMMGVRERLPEDVAAGVVETGRGARGRVHGALELAGTLVLLGWRVATLPSRMRAFEARLDDALGDRRPDLSSLRADELAGYYRALEGRLLAHWDAPIVNDFATMVFHGLLRRLCVAWIGAGDGLANDLLCGAGGVASEVPAQRVRAIAAAIAADGALVDLLCEGPVPKIRDALRRHPQAAAFDAYIDRYGERCLDELKLESATLHDDPLPLYRAVGRCARLDALPRTQAGPADGGPRATAERRIRKALARRPARRLAFGWVLARARRHVGDRERLRFQRTRVFGRARQIVVELGRRLAAIDCLDAPQDVFYLEFDEVLACAENRGTTSDLKSLCAARKAEFAAFETLPAPAERFETHGIALKGHDFAAARASAPPEGESSSGTACCPGVVRGRVRVVRDPARTALLPGEIIVAERTDPGWVMVFPAAAGLIVERGSLLSHSAIVARELGLPTIVSLPGLTQWLRDGDEVEMDGGTGSVTRLARSAPDGDGSRR